jgi:hypothetical protein
VRGTCTTSPCLLYQPCMLFRERLVTCWSSHHLRWYEPPQMNTSSASDRKEMSTSVNRCSHLDKHNISQEMSKDIILRVSSLCPHSVLTGWQACGRCRLLLCAQQPCTACSTQQAVRHVLATRQQHADNPCAKQIRYSCGRVCKFVNTTSQPLDLTCAHMAFPKTGNSILHKAISAHVRSG